MIDNQMVIVNVKKKKKSKYLCGPEAEQCLRVVTKTEASARWDLCQGASIGAFGVTTSEQK